MTIHVGRLESDVVPVPEPGDDALAARADWRETARLRALAARVARDRKRTRAEGHDD